MTPLDATGKVRVRLARSSSQGSPCCTRLQVPDLFPLCRAHTAPVLDTAWSPFDDSLVASAGEDCRVAITRVDDQILRDAWSGDGGDAKDLEPQAKFSGHNRKAGHVLWHPTANGILASASNDVKLWDVAAEKATYTSDVHADMVQSLSWDFCGTVFA